MQALRDSMRDSSSRSASLRSHPSRAALNQTARSDREQRTEIGPTVAAPTPSSADLDLLADLLDSVDAAPVTTTARSQAKSKKTKKKDSATTTQTSSSTTTQQQQRKAASAAKRARRSEIEKQSRHRRMVRTSTQ